jgi:hypothetical protein
MGRKSLQYVLEMALQEARVSQAVLMSSYGSEAADVATTPAESIEGSGCGSLLGTIQCCYRVLAGTRGAVAAAMRSDDKGALSWLAVGNISATLMCGRYGRLEVSAVACAHSGIVGYDYWLCAKRVLFCARAT